MQLANLLLKSTSKNYGTTHRKFNKAKKLATWRIIYRMLANGFYTFLVFSNLSHKYKVVSPTMKMSTKTLTEEVEVYYPLLKKNTIAAPWDIEWLT